MIKYIITPLFLCCLAFSAAADEVQLQPNHPERYVVVKGDTLWAISARFLKDPWQWPKVWKMNRAEIKNPHLIYPGDVVVLDMSGGTPQLRLLHETVTLQPGIREEPLEKEAVPTIAPNIIAPFLIQPLVIEKGALDDAPVILGGPENHVALAPGAKIYVTKIEEDAGVLWHIYRPGKTLVDPDSKELLGTEAIYLGDARITQFGEPASAQILTAKEEIFSNDKLVAAPETLQASFVPHAPDSEVSGRIMSVYGGVAEAGRSSIVTINKGAVDGLEQGHVLAINRYGRYVKNPSVKEKRSFWPKKIAPENDPTMIKLPDERIGLVMIFRTFDRVSYGLIMQASEPVNVLDMVKTP